MKSDRGRVRAQHDNDINRHANVINNNDKIAFVHSTETVDEIIMRTQYNKSVWPKRWNKWSDYMRMETGKLIGLPAYTQMNLEENKKKRMRSVRRSFRSITNYEHFKTCIITIFLIVHGTRRERERVVQGAFVTIHSRNLWLKTDRHLSNT